MVSMGSLATVSPLAGQESNGSSYGDLRCQEKRMIKRDQEPVIVRESPSYLQHPEAPSPDLGRENPSGEKRKYRGLR